MNAITGESVRWGEEKKPSQTWQRSLPAQIGGLLAWLAICFGASALGALATNRSVNGWYQTLAKPSWNPPDWLFGPVWSLLFFMMAVSAWLIWRREPLKLSRGPLALFILQLTLNVGWSIVFFAMKQPGWAAVEIATLWLAIAATALAFWPRSRAAALLLAPYLAWVSFAAVLNSTLWRLNS